MSRLEPSVRTALDALWLEHRRWVAAVLLAHMPKAADLEDLLQEVGMAMIQAIHTLENPAALRPWLRTIAINAARSAGRRFRVQQRHLRPLGEQDEALVDPAPARAVHEADVAAEITRARELIERMHPDFKEPLLLRCVQGMSQRQIAETLGLPETTIESRLVRARRMLRDALARACPEKTP